MFQGPLVLNLETRLGEWDGVTTFKPGPQDLLDISLNVAILKAEVAELFDHMLNTLFEASLNRFNSLLL